MSGVLPSHSGCCRDAVVDPGYGQHISYGGHTSPLLCELLWKTSCQRFGHIIEKKNYK